MRRRIVLFLALTLVATTAWPAGKVARPRVYDLIAGGEQDYTLAPGDNLWAITGRFTMSRALLQTWNELPDVDALRPGMHLRVSNRHIAPRRGSDGIVIDIAVRTLYWFQKGALRARFPIGVGRADRALPYRRTAAGSDLACPAVDPGGDAGAGREGRARRPTRPRQPPRQVLD